MTDTRSGDETVLLHETFDGYHREQDGGTFQHSHWDARWNAVVTSAGDDGALKSEELDVSGQDSLTVAFDAKAWLSSWHADFEGRGRHGEDSLTVKLIVDGHVRVLDTFYYDPHSGLFVGDQTGKSFGKGGFSSIAYEGLELDGASAAQLVFDSEITACDEFIKLDNVKITATKSADADDLCPPQVDTLLHEDFEGIHYPEQSDDVAGHTDWTIVDGKAFSTNCKEGDLTFQAVTLDGHTAGELRFDVKVNDVHRFESSGWAEDWLKVQIKTDGGHWVTIDTLQRAWGTDHFVGDQSGQTFGDDGMTTLVYRNEDIAAGAQTVQFRLVSHVTAHDEKIYVDNVKIDVEKTVCDTCADPESFEKGDADGDGNFDDAISAGTIVDTQFEHLTISAFASERAKTVHLEAEDMHDWNFDKKNGSKASGHEFEKLNAHADKGALWDHFDGDSGTYQVSARIQDENDGVSTVIFKIDGHEVKRVHLDKHSDQVGSDHGAFDKIDFGEHHIERGQEVKFVFEKNGHELGRIDKFTFTEVLGEPENRAMIFDADNPTGGDDDLGNGDGNVLIISEDGDRHDPDDNRKGGEIHLDFDVPVRFTSFDVIDTEEGGSVELFVRNGNGDLVSVGSVDLPRLPDGAVRTVDLTGITDQPIVKAVVTLNGSGAIDDLCYEKADEPNEHPTAVEDAFCFCIDPKAADGATAGFNIFDGSGSMDGLADSDPEGDAFFVSDVDGTAFSQGDTITFATATGATVTIDANGAVSYDGSTADYSGASITGPNAGLDVDRNGDGIVSADELVVGQTVLETFTYAISDGVSESDPVTVSIEVKGGGNTIESVKNLLPSSVRLSIDASSDVKEGYVATVESDGPAPMGDLIDLSGIYLNAYCANAEAPLGTALPTSVVDAHVYIAAPGTHPVDGVETPFVPDDVLDVFQAPDPNNPFGSLQVDARDNLDLVNWILNQDFTGLESNDPGQFTAAEVQEAIWELLNGVPREEPTDLTGRGIPVDDTNVDLIVSLAESEGEGFTPGHGDMFGVILDPKGPSPEGFDQPFIIGLEVDCMCP